MPCASRWPRSTPSSATSTATASASSRGSRRRAAGGADLVLFPELAVTGYPPEDLLLRPGFLKAAARTLEEIAAATTGIAALVGTPHLDRDLFNACAVCVDGEVKAIYRKQFLPNYGVFDEDRYFQPGPRPRPPPLRRDARRADGLRGHLAAGPARDRPRARRGPRRRQHLGLALPRRQGRRARGDAGDARARQLLLDRVRERRRRAGRADLRRPEPRPRRERRGRRARAGLRGGAAPGRRRRDDRRGPQAPRRAPARPGPRAARAARAAGRGRADRRRRASASRRSRRSPSRSASSRRCGSPSSSACATTPGRTAFTDVVLGLSGGIDSALTAALAAEALGPEHVVCVSMPSRFSSAETRQDAQAVAESLGARYLEIPIDPIVDAFGTALAGAFADTEPGVAEENVQARARGVIVMALSNKFGWLALATGNKSELSVGYATLYGDMAGGFALLKDVYKTDVFRLARHLNERAGRELIPASMHRARPERRAAARPARRGLAAAVRQARRGARGLRRAGQLARGADLGRLRPGRRRARRRA